MSTNRTWRFGVYEVDTRRVELRRNGTAIKLREQPFSILVHLLEHAGEIVSREELRRVLWPSDTFVDFDHSLSMAVMNLREALGDSSETPLYIETIPKRGYRFIAPVTSASEIVNGTMSSRREPALFAINGTSEATQRAAEPADAGLQLRWWMPAVAVLFVGIFASTIWYFRHPLPPPHISEYGQLTHDGKRKDLVGADGTRLYFNRPTDSQLIAQVSMSGGEIVPVPVPLPYPWLRDVAPDGSALLVASLADGKQWTVGIPGLSLRQISEDIATVSAAWSPDGKSLAYRTAEGDIGLMRSDGTEAHRLIALHDRTESPIGEPPSWSPDGSKIRFTRNNTLWEMSSDGSGLHQLLPGWRPSFFQCCGRWTPDGNLFIFLLRNASLGPFPTSTPVSQLWAIDERRTLLHRASTEPVQLTSGPVRWDTPVPGKRGNKIFARGVIQHGELVRFDRRTQQLEPYLGGISAEFVTFSHDGKFVAYVTFPQGILWRANRDGSNPIQLTDPPWYPILPRWSPDGTQIVFGGPDMQGRIKAFIVSSNGGKPRLLLPESDELQGDPDWSPGGRKVVFVAAGSLGGKSAGGKLVSTIQVFDLETHKISTVPGSQGARSPRWSPDGRFISVLFGDTDGLEILDVKKQSWSVLSKGPAEFPEWSRDSRFIYFLHPFEHPGVRRIRISGGAEESVVYLRTFRFTGFYAGTMGLDPTDAPLLLRDIGTDDIFALTIEQK